MAVMFGVSANLRIRRSAQSGNYTMTAAWQSIYSNSQNYAWFFAAGEIDLSNMVAGDDVAIRISKRNIASGAYILKDYILFEDAQPTNQQKITIGPIMDTFGVLVEMQQTVGALITCYCEFFDAVR